MKRLKRRHVFNTLHIIAKTYYRPWDRALVPELEGRAEALANTFQRAGGGKHVVGVCEDWVERESGARMIRELEGQAAALARSRRRMCRT